MSENWYTDEHGFRRKGKKPAKKKEEKKTKKSGDLSKGMSHTWGGLKTLSDLFRKVDDKKGKVNE